MMAVDIPEGDSKRYFCKSSSGTDLFYIELSNFGGCNYFFSSMLPENLMQDCSIQRLINFIANKIITERTRLEIIRKLFIEINKIPKIDSHFLRKHSLNKFGQFDEELHRKALAVIENFSPRLNQPYSERHLAHEFEIVRDVFDFNPTEEEAVELSKEEFEDKVSLNSNLQDAYVDVYSERDVKYYCDEAYLSDGPAFVYYMTVEGKLVFFFLFKFR